MTEKTFGYLSGRGDIVDQLIREKVSWENLAEHMNNWDTLILFWFWKYARRALLQIQVKFRDEAWNSAWEELQIPEGEDCRDYLRAMTEYNPENGETPFELSLLMDGADVFTVEFSEEDVRRINAAAV